MSNTLNKKPTNKKPLTYIELVSLMYHDNLRKIQALGINYQSVSYAKQKMVARGYLSPKGRMTLSGRAELVRSADMYFNMMREYGNA